ncbi:hypothetical protein SETIT_5G037200v2 [Setaria italica]|uniref:Uncharacterized protein n=1 Tax=Setaria italica TaxID=4555 RepID=A0A368R137_SETIT|nr:hypothetical protein SETIT_5G037200v2 [Setaria italica]
MDDSLHVHLVPRLSHQAAEELSELSSLLEHVILRDGADLRISPLTSDTSLLQASDRSSLGVNTTDSSVTSLWTVPRPTMAPAKHYSTFLILLCWILWKHRNDVVFQRAPASRQRLWMSCREEARLWRERFRPSERTIADA